MRNKVDLVVHSSSPWYCNRFNTAPRIALGIAALTLLPALAEHRPGAEYSNSLNSAILIAVEIAGIFLSFYQTNISSEISPVVHSSSAWYGNNFNTTPRIVLGIVALTLLLVLAAHFLSIAALTLRLVLAAPFLGVEDRSNLITVILTTLEIAVIILSFDLVLLSKPGDNEPPLLSTIRYLTLSLFHFSGLAGRCPHPQMIVRA